MNEPHIPNDEPYPYAYNEPYSYVGILDQISDKYIVEMKIYDRDKPDVRLGIHFGVDSFSFTPRVIEKVIEALEGDKW